MSDIIENLENTSLWKRIFNWKKISLNIKNEFKNILEKYVQKNLNPEEIEKISKFDSLNKNFIEKNILLSKEKEINEQLKKDFEELKQEKQKFWTKLIQKEEENKNLNSDLVKEKDKSIDLLNKLDNFKKSLESSSEATRNLTNIFNKQPAKRGKIAELRLRDIIINTINDDKLYTENLKIGNNIVEFGLKSNINSNNWIPVDSKLIEPKIDINNNLILDDNYKKEIIKRAKDISKKYVGTKITENYGILVVQNDFIFTEVVQDNNFTNELQKLKIYISSPSTFIQFINTIDKISFDLKLVDEIDKFKEELEAIISPIRNFVKNSKEGIAKINKAFEKNLISIENKIPKIESSMDRISQKNLINNKEVIDI